MKITKDTHVTFHYTLKDRNKEVIDTTLDEEPIPYLHGYKQIVLGLENAMEGKAAGDQFKVTVAPQLGYGLHDEAKVFDVERSLFDGMPDLEPGAMVQLTNPQGHPEVVVVLAIDDETVTVDANHPYAGETLNFEIEVVSVRAATESEIQQVQI
jgi:FKBP-type peptidyl-prolyl cis-trans isomerase SlyD